MRSVGVQELKEHTSEILRDVQEGQIIDITSGGSAVARLVPVQPPALSDGEVEAILDDLDSLAAEISARWPEGLSARDAIDDVRR
jgi:prevent-host-death family protein